MELSEIKKTVDLLKRANITEFVTLIELSKELKVKKTQVMSFLEENEKLFNLSQRWIPKEKKIMTTFLGKPYEETINEAASECRK